MSRARPHFFDDVVAVFCGIATTGPGLLLLVACACSHPAVRVTVSDECGFLLDSIYFEVDAAVPPPHQTEVLDATAAMFICHANKGEPLHVEVGGHTDDRERDPRALSNTRAAWTKDELVKRGVPADLLTTRGNGSLVPIDSRETPQARAKNRRVELVVLPSHPH